MYMICIIHIIYDCCKKKKSEQCPDFCDWLTGNNSIKFHWIVDLVSNMTKALIGVSL